MTIQESTTLRNAKLNQIETVIGQSPKIQIFSGSPPANCAAADSGTKLAEITGDATSWMADAANGSVSKNGAWATTGLAAGTAGHYRIKDSTGTTCHQQGTCSMSGGGGDMILDNTNIAVGQSVTVSTFTLTAGNA